MISFYAGKLPLKSKNILYRKIIKIENKFKLIFEKLSQMIFDNFVSSLFYINELS